MADNTINGTTGDDTLRTENTAETNEVYGGAGNDVLVDGSTFNTDDSYYGGAGDDNIRGGGGNDVVAGGTGADTVIGGGGDDTFLIEDDFGIDSLSGGGFDEVTGDVVDATAMTADATLTFGVEIASGGGGPGGGGPGPGDSGPGSGDGGGFGGGDGEEEGGPPGGGGEPVIGARLETGTDNLAEITDVESFRLGSGNDTVIDDAGDNTVDMGGGDDEFRITDGFGNDIVTGGEAGETIGDLINGAALTVGATVTFTGDGSGTFTDGTSTLTFADVERIETGAGADIIIGSTGGESVNGNDGDDTFFFGDNAGDDFFRGGEGAETLGDTLDGSALTTGVIIDYTGDTATMTDGTNAAGFAEVEQVILGAGDDFVTGDTGNESIVTNAGNDTFAVRDNFGTDTVDLGSGQNVVDGTALTTDATISFTADGVGTLTSGANTVDFTGAASVATGSGADSFASSALNETIATHEGDDTVTLTDGFGTDVWDAGEGGEAVGDRIDATALSGATTVIINSDGSGSLTDGSSTLTFQHVEQFDTGSGNDTITSGSGDETATTGAGNDTFIVSDNFGTDAFNAGSDTDTLDATALTGDTTTVFTAGGSGTLTQEVSNLNFTDVEIIKTGASNDTIVSSSDSDTINTGAGNDTFSINDGFGSDSFEASSGVDAVDGANLTTDATVNLTGSGSGTLTAGGDTLNFSGVEIVTTGAGNDDVTSSTADETVNTGAGDDTLYLSNRFGTDVFDAGEGGQVSGDTVDASAMTTNVQVNFAADEAGTLVSGPNTLTFSGVERIITGSGRDQVNGSNQSEIITTGDGDDQIEGNGGADTIFSGAGDDQVVIGQGDTVNAGSGDDVIRVENTGETATNTINIDGGSENTATGDILRLGRLADLDTLDATDDGTGSLSGFVFLKDGTRLNFTNIEQVICFTPGTMIGTPHGPRDIARLRVGDMVRTRDHGPQKIRWIQSRTVPATGNFAPIRIRPGVITGLTHDLLVSPQHRMLLTGARAELLFGDREVLVSATHLVDGKDVTQDAGGTVTYIHMMFDCHEIVYANGAASESFHPGAVGLNGVTEKARDELFRIFPEIRSNPNGYGQTARRCLKQHETRLLSV